MKIIILHKDIAIGHPSSFRYFIERGKGISKQITLYDFFYHPSTKRVVRKTFRLFYWEIDMLKKHFSIYN